MALRTHVWSAGKIVVLACGLVATYVLCAAGSMRLALKAREVLFKPIGLGELVDAVHRNAREPLSPGQLSPS